MIAVFTQPDRPKGRGQKDAMSPVKEAALRLGIRGRINRNACGGPKWSNSCARWRRRRW